MADINRDEVLRGLAAKRFENWNESDVREDFIAPLLRLLGYEKGSDYDINRESQHLLSKPFLMIGSKKQKLDYALVARRKTFWLLEAKRPDPAQIQDEAVFQAHFYALHPEVSARYFGVCNGREIVLYDVRAIDDNYLPLLRISTKDLPARFVELEKVIGASSLVQHLKQRVLEDTRAILSAEILEEQVARFSLQLNEVLREVVPVVRENRLSIWHRKFQEQQEKFVELADQGTVSQIPEVLLGFAWNRAQFELSYNSYVSKLELLRPTEQIAEIAKLPLLLEQPLRSLHRFKVLQLLLRMHSRSENVVEKAAKEFVLDAIRGFELRPHVRAQWKLEAALHRLFYKASFAAPELLAMFRDTATAKLASMKDEDRVWNAPSVWGERNKWVRERIEILWERLRRHPAEELFSTIKELEAQEQEIEAKCAKEIRAHTSEEGDLSFFENYDRPWDYMRSGLFNVLVQQLDIAARLIGDDDLREVGKLLRMVSADYNLNYADELWVKLTTLRGRVVVPTSLAGIVTERLPIDCVSEFLSAATIQRKGKSAFSEGVLAIGNTPGGYLELDVRLDLDNAQVTVEGGRPRR